jgi:hypothetical protein
VNGAGAAQGEGNQNVQALTFHQVSPRLLVYASVHPRREKHQPWIRNPMNPPAYLRTTMLEYPKRARSSLAKVKQLQIDPKRSFIFS